MDVSKQQRFIHLGYRFKSSRKTNKKRRKNARVTSKENNQKNEILV